MKKARSGLTGPQTRVNCARCGREVWGKALNAAHVAICKYCSMVAEGRLGKLSGEADD